MMKTTMKLLTAAVIAATTVIQGCATNEAQDGMQSKLDSMQQEVNSMQQQVKVK